MKFGECRYCGFENNVDDNNCCNECKASGKDKVVEVAPILITKDPEITKLGRLHLVNKCKIKFYCRECGIDIPVGSSCYTQSANKDKVFFPIQTRLCMSCGQVQIDGGVLVADKKKKVKDGSTN